MKTSLNPSPNQEDALLGCDVAFASFPPLVSLVDTRSVLFASDFPIKSKWFLCLITLFI